MSSTEIDAGAVADAGADADTNVNGLPPSTDLLNQSSVKIEQKTTTTTTTVTTTKKKILLEGDEDDVDFDEDKLPSPVKGSVSISTAGTAGDASSSSSPSPSTSNLIPQIITPSPFQHHNDSATSDRYRSALQRITISPLHDVEAWEAIMTECMSLYRTQLLPQMEEDRKTFKLLKNGTGPNGIDGGAVRNVDLEKKLDWVESCHGHLLHYFPYTAGYCVSIVEVLLARGALPFESLTGGDEDFSFGIYLQRSSSQQIADRKVERIFENILGVKMDGTPSAGGGVTVNGLRRDVKDSEGDMQIDSSSGGGLDKGESSSLSPPQALLGGMCTSSVDLWLLFIRKRSRDAKRKALEDYIERSSDPNNTKITQEGEELIRNWIIEAYETALNNGASFVHNNDAIWKQYLAYVKSWNIMMANPLNTAELTINHMLHSKQKELLRSIYQRIVTLPMTGLDSLWTEYEVYEKAQSEQLATALIAEHMPKYQHARSVYLERNRVYNINDLRWGKVATPPADYEKETTNITSSNNDMDEKNNKAKIIEEMQLLAKWKRRCAYERTNPERLSNTDLTIRVRQCFKDTICAFMRHIEVWHEWCMWELHNLSAGGGAVTPADATKTGKKRNVQFAIAVLTLAQLHIPDCTLLAYANATILENQVGGAGGAEEAIDVMTKFCNRAGNTLGYILLQRLVRKYKGVKEARQVFSTARKLLQVRAEDVRDGLSGKADGTSSEHKIDKAGDDGATTKVETLNGRQDTSMKSSTGSENGSKKKLVTNRDTFSVDSKANSAQLKSISDGGVANLRGVVTWHLYASHASIEHRINKLPHVAARVYELGLRKHRTFLATPQYVLQYCTLLFELGDEENLRALLTRAIAACEEVDGEQINDIVGTNSTSKSGSKEKRERRRPLWDTMLRFESIVSARTGDQTSLRDIESRRRHALFGPENEDVSGGNFLDEGDVGIGMHKISLSDTLIRSNGYDVSSRIVNGLDRMVDSLEISGILGESYHATNFNLGAVWKDDGVGGLSDTSFRRRKMFQTERSIIAELAANSSDLLRNTPLGSGVAGSTSGKLSSAKERLAQNAFQNQNMTVTAAVLSSPEWLRDMLLLLPATARNFRGAKAPPHMIEMALAALRDNSLPSSRPSDPVQNPDTTALKRKRPINDGDSSDEENGHVRGGGYGNQFRARQRAKLMGASVGTSQ